VRASAEDEQHVHLRAQVDVRARRGVPGDELQLTLGIRRDLREQVDVRHQVARAEAPLAELDQQLIARVAIKLVAM
jgi:hypothetical protein